MTSTAELAALPPLERTELQSLGVAALSVPRAVGVTRVTSGSSGRPVRVLWGLEAMGWVDATERRLREWLGVRLGEPRVHVRSLAVGRRRLALAKAAVNNLLIVSPAVLPDPVARRGILSRLAGR